MATTYRHPYIAREGWGAIALCLILAGGVWWSAGTLPALPLLVFFVGMVFYFRDPIRRIPARPLGVVSPVDGVVKSVIDQVTDPHLEREQARCIVIQQTWWGVHSLRSPIEGKVMERWFNRGGEGGSESTIYWIRTDEGDDVVWDLQAASYRWLRLDLQPGERVGQGQRCGFAIRPLSTRVYLPRASRLLVQEGQRVRAGEGVLAEFVHRRADLGAVVEGRHAIP